MKQHITLSQLSELKQPELHKLYRWCLDKKYVESVSEIDWVRSDMQLSIGQMIEFLWENKYEPEEWEMLTFDDTTPQLCDDLWQACVEVLENNY